MYAIRSYYVGETSLANQIKYLNDAADEVVSRLRSINDAIKGNSA